MAIIRPKLKTFPLWFQDETKNANYGIEYQKCLNNLPIDSMDDSYTTVNVDDFFPLSRYNNKL